MEGRPFEIDIPAKKVREILERVRNYDWSAFRSPDDDSNWQYGPPVSFMKDLCEYWGGEKYDFRAHQKRWNRHPQYKASISGVELHFVHVKAHDSEAPALLLLHGWPYSFYSLFDLVDRLRHRFHLVVPSMPGYHFSSAPRTPMGAKTIAHIYNKLMVQTLDYAHYFVHGGDWGSQVADLLGLYHPESVLGIHWTQYSVRHHNAAFRDGFYPVEADKEEKTFAKLEAQCWSKGQGAYSQLQAFKSNKVAFALADSPVGAAAWILEAFHAWSDLSQASTKTSLLKDQGGPFDVDDLIDEVMLYLVSDSLPSSMWIYAGEILENCDKLGDGDSVKVPCAILALSDPVFPMPPRSVAEKSHCNIIRYTSGHHGGHFAFYEVPEMLAQDICHAFALVTG